MKRKLNSDVDPHIKGKDNNLQKTNNKKLKTRLVNLKVKYLRKEGFNNLEEWMEKPDHVFIGRGSRVFIHTKIKVKEAPGSKVAR